MIAVRHSAPAIWNSLRKTIISLYSNGFNLMCMGDKDGSNHKTEDRPVFE